MNRRLFLKAAAALAGLGPVAAMGAVEKISSEGVAFDASKYAGARSFRRPNPAWVNAPYEIRLLGIGDPTLIYEAKALSGFTEFDPRGYPVRFNEKMERVYPFESVNNKPKDHKMAKKKVAPKKKCK